MPVHIRVRNFQSLSDAEIVVDRFTVITGTNNAGKSAVLRAIQGVFANTPGDALVRHGAEKLVVDVRFDDGHAVRWEKGPKVKPTYVIDGKAIHPGRAVPDEVAALGIRPVAAGQVLVWPQVAPQFTGQVFLLDQSGATVAEAVADVDHVGKLTSALRFAESDKRSAAVDVRLRRQDVEVARLELAAYDGVDAVASCVGGVERRIQELRDLAHEVECATQWQADLQRYGREVARQAEVRAVQIPTRQRVVQMEGLREEALQLASLQRHLFRWTRDIRALKGVRDVILPPRPMAVVGSTAESLQVASRLSVTLKRAQARRDAARVAAGAVRGLSLGRIGTHLQGVARVAQVTSEVLSLQDGLRATRASLARLRVQATGVRSEYDASVIEVQTLLEQMGSCPTCGTPTT